ncbi:hypothetical protein QMK34_43920, partial [Amycolatopsis sp. H20-H5]|nr:hypothetical protein [Amycolatopsis sp. H20-H5]
WSEERPVSDLSAAFPNRDAFADRLRPSRVQPPAERKPEPTPTPTPKPEPIAETPSRHGAHRSPAEEPVIEVNPTLPEEARQPSSRPGGRRRRAEDDDAVAIPSRPATPAAESTGGGRRRRPDGEAPAWQAEPAIGGSHSANGYSVSGHSANGHSTNGHSTNGHSANGNSGNGHSANGNSGTGPSSNGHSGNGHSGGHARPESDTNGTSRGRRSDDREEAPAGSHAAGRSVTELLAAHGANESTPRRRRRAED